MNQYQLDQLNQKALRKAYRVRNEEARRANTEQIARAWERLADAADHLHAIYARAASFTKQDPPPQPNGEDGGSSDDPWGQRPQFQG